MNQSTSKSHQQTRTLNRYINLDIRRSIGEISYTEYKRRVIRKQLNFIAYDSFKSHKYPEFLNSSDSDFHQSISNITNMEIDPEDYQYLLVASESNVVAVYNVDRDVKNIEPSARLTIPSSDIHSNIPNSVHWLNVAEAITVGTKSAVHVWDSNTCARLESYEISRCEVLNHVVGTNKCVAATGIDGLVFVIDTACSDVVLIVPNVQKFPIRTINWHPINDFLYVTGNDGGNILLWDVRSPKNFIYQFKDNDSGRANSHSRPVTGLSFYNNGLGILSVDQIGTIKAWDVNQGCRFPINYEPVQFNRLNKNYLKSYQFATTQNLKQDIAFMPSKRGMKMLDIDTGKHLRHSSDIPVPLNGACSYNSRHVCVYSALCNIIKIWSVEQNCCVDLNSP